MPFQKVSQKTSDKQKPWVTIDLANSAKKKNKTYKQLSKSKDIKKNSFAKKIQTLQKSLFYNIHMKNIYYIMSKIFWRK